MLYLTASLQSQGYQPAHCSVAKSYHEISSGGQRVATQFWTKQSAYARGRPGGERIYS